MTMVNITGNLCQLKLSSAFTLIELQQRRGNTVIMASDKFYITWTNACSGKIIAVKQVGINQQVKVTNNICVIDDHQRLK